MSIGRRAAADARAKVNLSLRVLAREESGYHQIETVYCALELADSIDVEIAGDDIVLDVRGADLGDPRGNLVYRAATAYFAAIDTRPTVRIALHKNIPHGAGLGGGSSDAATTLCLLDMLHDERLGLERLMRIAATIGADVPYFVAGAPLALAWGRGERVLPLRTPAPREVVLVAPDEPMPTALAYAELARGRARAAAIAPRATCIDYAALDDWDAIARSARNDFEPIVFERIAGLEQAKRRLVEAGGRFALVAGSGSALFAVFHDRHAADDAAERIRSAFEKWRIIRTRTAATPLHRPRYAPAVG